MNLLLHHAESALFPTIIPIHQKDDFNHLKPSIIHAHCIDINCDEKITAIIFIVNIIKKCNDRCIFFCRIQRVQSVVQFEFDNSRTDAHFLGFIILHLVILSYVIYSLGMTK
jgi:hypothetical protein